MTTILKNTIGRLEGEMLRILWAADKPLSSTDMFDALYVARKQRGDTDTASPSTIAVTLSQMSQKGLLTMERSPGKFGAPGAGKGYYKPVQSMAQGTLAVLNANCLHLTGQPFSCILQLLDAPQSITDPQFADLAYALRQLREKAGGQV